MAIITTTTISPPPVAAATASSPPSAVSLVGRVGFSVRVRFPPRGSQTLDLLWLGIRRNPSSTRLNAGLTEIEPDLEEDKHDPYRTNGVEPEDFKYGEYDGHHTYFEGNEGPFWETAVAEYEAAEPPKGFQGIISWLFLPAIMAGLVYNVPGEYLYIGAGIFVIIFCAIEIAKPDKPHNFEPYIYNMETVARDKLIEKYNTMDIWDFNEKYGDLWDFTIKRDDLLEELRRG